MISKEEGFYIQEEYSYINVLGRIGTSACSVEVVPTVVLLSFMDSSIHDHKYALMRECSSAVNPSSRNFSRNGVEKDWPVNNYNASATWE